MGSFPEGTPQQIQLPVALAERLVLQENGAARKEARLEAARHTGIASSSKAL